MFPKDAIAERPERAMVRTTLAIPRNFYCAHVDAFQRVLSSECGKG